VAGLKIPGKPAKIEDGWNVRLMEALLKASFAQDFEAARALKETGNRPITHTQDRGIWATEFPRIITEIRDGLKLATFEGEKPSTSPALRSKKAAVQARKSGLWWVPVFDKPNAESHRKEEGNEVWRLRPTVRRKVCGLLQRMEG
jgi:hypothetical protein